MDRATKRRIGKAEARISRLEAILEAAGMIEPEAAEPEKKGK